MVGSKRRGSWRRWDIDGVTLSASNFIPVTNLIHKFVYSYNGTVLYM